MLRTTRLLLLAAGLLASFVGAAHAQYYGQNKVQYRPYQWRTIESDHFEVYFYTGLDSLAMRVLDLAEKTHVVLSARMGHPLSRRVPIILYGSHNDFTQTNVTPELIDAGTGGFTEVLRNRVVLPFTGSYEDLRHVVVHELVHAVMFDLLYGGSAAALLARQSFYSVPLWFAEGMAEYFSLGVDPNAEMYVRDGIVEGYLPPLAYAGGFLVYKQGQSAVGYLVDRFGEDRLRDLLQRTRQHRSFERAFAASLGTSFSTFEDQWRTSLRRQYWPTVRSKEPPDRFARRLTDHRKDPSNANLAPAISPQGDRVAYTSDRRQYTDVYVMSGFDGKISKRVIRGERNVQYEVIPSFRSSLTWSPEGERLAIAAKSGGTDVLYIVGAESGQTLMRVKMPCESLAYPAWSPNGERIVVAGLMNGRSDLWLVDLKTRQVRRLTNDTWDEKEPTWSPDGNTITFASDRLAPVVLHPERDPAGFGRYGIFGIDVATHEVTRTVDTYGNDHSPAWSPDGRRLAFVSDRDGTSNIYLYDTSDRSFIQLTDVMGGVQSLSWSRQNDRLVFSAFDRGGFDIFAVKEPLSLDPVIQRLREKTPAAVLDSLSALSAVRDTSKLAPNRAALARTVPDAVTTGEPDTTVAIDAGARSPAPPAAAAGTPGGGSASVDLGGSASDSTTSSVEQAVVLPTFTDHPDRFDDVASAPPDSVHGTAAGAVSAHESLDPFAGAPARFDAVATVADSAQVDSTKLDAPMAASLHAEGSPSAGAGAGVSATAGASGGAAPGDSTHMASATDSTLLASRSVLVDRGGLFALPDSVLGQKPTRYRPRLSLDQAGGGFYAASGFGVVGSTQFIFSDFLGDHNLYIATDLFSSSIEEANALAIYRYVRNRFDWGFGFFHFKDYFSARVTTLGEQLGSPRLFSERTFGGLLNASYPFDRFHRIELNLTQMFVDRRFFDEDQAGNLFETAHEYRAVTTPALSLISDNTLFGYYGPVNGQRWNFTYAPALPTSHDGLQYQTVTLDGRRYWDLTRGYTFAGRVLFGASSGRDAQTFRVGGYSSLRGYSDFDMLGTRMAIVNAELRFPFIQELGILGPIPVGVFNLRGALFGDAGFVWNQGDELRLTHVSEGKRRLDDMRVGFGAGIRTAIYFMILKVDAAWNTDFAGASQPRWHVSIGPEF